MTLLKDFLEKEILGVGFANSNKKIALQKFAKYISEDTNEKWGLVLSIFARKAPWTYWDESVVEEALEILEDSSERTVEAINERSKQIGVAIDNLFRLSSALKHQESLDASKSRDLLVLSTEFHPEYLRHTEHIFGNLLSLYWSILKKGSVQGKFDIRGGSALVKKDHNSILIGYNDRVRNAIAHGQVTFKGLGSVQYGDERANYSLSSSDFLKTFDELWRTCNSQTIALILFLARNEAYLLSNEIALPPSLITFISSSIIERKTLTISGAIESETAMAGKQLHIFVETSYLKREWVMFDCIRLSALLLNHGANGYDRFLFDIDQGKKVSSMLIVKTPILKGFLDDPLTPMERIDEVLDDSPMLFFDESNFSHRLKAWKEIFPSLFEYQWKELDKQWEKLGLKISNQSYRVIKEKNVSSELDRRIHIYAVLTDHEFIDDREYIKRIIKKIIKKYSKKIVNKESTFKRKMFSAGKPIYVWVSLYKNDGTIRWVTSDGWLGNNLIATGEKVFSIFKKPIFIQNPEEIWKGIRFRYSLDSPAYNNALVNLATTLSDIETKKVE